jgi:Raf kinase inhibitor-like YbhB/YbcL family protein
MRFVSARSVSRSAGRLALVGLLGVVVVACSDDDSSSDSGSSDPTSSTSASGSSPSTSSSTKPAKAMDLTTPAFADGETIPVEYTCSGAGTAPELRWSEPPAGTEQIAVVVFDPDARAGEGFVHYVGWGIDPATRELTADGYAQATLGANGTGAPGWIPPCPPPGDESHRYEFRIYALSGEPSVPPGTDLIAFQEAIRDQILSQGTVIGSFSR